MQSKSQPRNRCKEGEEGLEVSSSSWKSLSLSKLESGWEDTRSNKSLGIIKPTFHQFQTRVEFRPITAHYRYQRIRRPIMGNLEV